MLWIVNFAEGDGASQHCLGCRSSRAWSLAYLSVPLFLYMREISHEQAAST
jgi:hypothetical protein